MARHNPSAAVEPATVCAAARVVLPDHHPARAPEEPFELRAQGLPTGDWIVTVPRGPDRLRRLRVMVWRAGMALVQAAAAPGDGLKAARAQPAPRPSADGQPRRARRPATLLAALLTALAVVPNQEHQAEPHDPDAGASAPEPAPTLTARPADAATAALTLTLTAPMPDEPLEGQARPPCRRQQGEREARGACWYRLAQEDALPPCWGTYEHEGRCYVPIQAGRPRPSVMDGGTTER